MSKYTAVEMNKNPTFMVLHLTGNIKDDCNVEYGFITFYLTGEVEE